MLVMQYEGECKHCIQLKKSALTLLLMEMFDGIDETMNESDELLRWVLQKYGMSRIIGNLHSIEKQLLLPCCYQ